jgi:hypothetical protein
MNTADRKSNYYLVTRQRQTGPACVIHEEPIAGFARRLEITAVIRAREETNPVRQVANVRLYDPVRIRDT